MTAATVQLAAADTESAETPDLEAAPRLNETDAYRLALLKMKGHLSVARALLQMRAEGAGYHMREPLQDIFRMTEAELERRKAPFTADVLHELLNAVGSDPVLTLTALESAVTAINGSFAQTGAINGDSVLALSEALLHDAVSKYAAAVADNEVVDLRKYQSGRGFVTEAERLVRHASRLKRQPGHDALLLAVTLIRQSWPGIMPPPIVFDPPMVAARLKEAVAAMDRLR